MEIKKFPLLQPYPSSSESDIYISSIPFLFADILLRVSDTTPRTTQAVNAIPTRDNAAPQKNATSTLSLIRCNFFTVACPDRFYL